MSLNHNITGKIKISLFYLLLKSIRFISPLIFTENLKTIRNEKSSRLFNFPINHYSYSFNKVPIIKLNGILHGSLRSDTVFFRNFIKYIKSFTKK